MPYQISQPGPDAAPPPEPVPAQLAFADLAWAGKNAWWRYLLAIVTLVAIAVVLQLAVTIAAGVLDVPLDSLLAETDEPAAAGTSGSLATFILIMLSIGVLVPATVVPVVLFHRRPARTLFTARRRFDWRATIVSTGVVLATATGLTVLWWLAFPGSIAFAFDPARFFLFLPFVVLLVPLQVLAEEVLFRGYILQTVGRITASALVRLVVPAALFVAIHIPNEEFQAGGAWAALDYAVIALYLGYLAMRGDGLEYATGLHLGLNASFFTVVGYSVSWVETPAIFLIQDYDFRSGVLATVIICAVHYVVVMRRLVSRSDHGWSGAESR